MQSTLEDCSPKFSVRIVVVDHYMAKPIPGIDVVYSEFRGFGLKQVPILRVFGPASDGHKACIHVHGVFPYFYIPCSEPCPQPQLLYRIAASLDKALNISMKQTNSTDQHVYCIKLVKGLPFYGFHYKEHLFLKVFLYNPGLIKQAVELLQNGAVLSQVFQPYEAHLNFHLQFFIDFNLFGMIYMQLQRVQFRLEDNEDVSEIKRMSMCHYEGDCLASHIINRLKVGKGNGIENPGLEAVWKEEMERRKALNASLAFRSKLTPRNDDLGTDSHHKFEKTFWLKMSNLIEKPVSVSQSDVISTKSFEALSYPAEYPEDSQLLDATNVTFHQPTHSNESITFIEREVFDDTVIDEAACLNCSLTQGTQGTQLSLDTDDLDFVEMLKDMDQQVDNDSILGTQAEAPKSGTVVDADEEVDYSQVFHDDTLQVMQFDEEGDTGDKNISPDWEDSFWGSSRNIPQLDGADDEGSDSNKGTGRKKKRTRSLGLVAKRKKIVTNMKSLKINCVSQSEESCSKSITEYQQGQTESEEFVTKFIEDNEENDNHNDSFFLKMTPEFLDILQCSAVKKQSDKHNPLKMSGEMNSKHKDEDNDMNNESATNKVLSNKQPERLFSSPDSDNNSFCRDGIKSFYDISNVFDATLDGHNKTVIETESVLEKLDQQPNATSETVENMDVSTIIKLRHTDTLAIKSHTYLRNNVLNNTSFGMKLILTPKVTPPSKHDVCSTLNLHNILEKNNFQPYYSNYKDVGSRIEVGQMILKMSSRNVIHLKAFDKILPSSLSIEEWQRQIFTGLHGSDLEVISGETLNSLLACNRKTILGPLEDPPSRKEVEDWLKIKNDEQDACEVKVKIIDEDMPQDMENYESTSNASQKMIKSKGTEDSFHQSIYTDGSFLCFGGNSELSHGELTAVETSTVDYDFLTIMAIEVNTYVRGDLRPDPEFDSINSIFYIVTNDCPEKHFLPKEIYGSIVVADQSSPLKFDRCAKEVTVEYVGSELDLIYKFLQVIKKWDPDILCGYEIEMNSWGYLLERTQNLGLEILHEVSRITTVKKSNRNVENNNYEGKITGRIIFGVWRLLRYELALSSYSFEATMFAVLKERMPSYSPKTLAEWWDNPTHLLRWMTVEYYMSRLSGTLKMLEKLDFVNRTSELARLFGLQWWEVLSRGSQYRVESLMLRAARPLNLIALSPSVKQRSTMKAPEILPLIFEPESRFYADPVIVLDFQSLYPSMMIAYNYCFSTCLGKVQNINGDAAYELGAWRLRVPGEKLRKLVKRGLVHWSPVGSGFVTSEVRCGVLPVLLRRILAARQAVKANAKLQTDENVKKAMHSRQLGLKLIANVTYGYTAANFSGRMPCVEVADSVVAKGRETLERAIKLVESNREWNVKVVYGDTDSMFVMVPGGTLEQAFDIGAEIAAAVTADNPSPVTLKLEKVYQPCILQTKKRYVGYMYETPETTSPVYEAKGIETVRRDGCPAGVELLTRSLCELFSSGDVSRVKRIVYSVLSRLLNGQLPLLELAFSREYHGPTGYRPGAAAPPLELARRLQKKDRRSTPRVSERISWVVCWGAPGQPLVKLARSPAELLAEPQLRPHTTYYATRVLLPPLARCFSLIGVDVFQWYSEIPRRPELGVGGIVQYMWRESCMVCGQRSVRYVCPVCATEPHTAVHAIMNMLRNTSQHHSSCGQICSSCTGHRYYAECTALECPVLWRRQYAAMQLQQATEAVGNISLSW